MNEQRLLNRNGFGVFVCMAIRFFKMLQFLIVEIMEMFYAAHSRNTFKTFGIY